MQAMPCHSWSQHPPAHTSSNLPSHQVGHIGPETKCALQVGSFSHQEQKQDHSLRKKQAVLWQNKELEMDDNTRVFFPCRDEELLPDCFWRLHMASILTSLHFYSDVVLILSIISNSKTNVVDILCVSKLNLGLFKKIATSHYN